MALHHGCVIYAVRLDFDRVVLVSNYLVSSSFNFTFSLVEVDFPVSPTLFFQVQLAGASRLVSLRSRSPSATSIRPFEWRKSRLCPYLLDMSLSSINP